MAKKFTADELFNPEPAVVNIPYEYSIAGELYIDFREYSFGNNIWGIWDIIVSDRNEIPKIRQNQDPKKIEARFSGRM